MTLIADPQFEFPNLAELEEDEEVYDAALCFKVRVQGIRAEGLGSLEFRVGV